MNLASNLKLGIDIGGSKILAVVWDGKKIQEKWQSQTSSLESLKELVGKFKIKNIGVAVPGILDFKTKRILKCQNLPEFNNIDLAEFLGREIKIDNDVKCFLSAEIQFGVAKEFKNVLALMLGTGIGGAVKISKLKKESFIYRGKSGGAGEFGHMVIDNGKTWENLYQEAKNNPEEQEKINSIAIANLINIFDPDVIVMGGGGVKIPKIDLINPYIIFPLAKNPSIVFSGLGEEAVAIGAALLNS